MSSREEATARAVQEAIASAKEEHLDIWERHAESGDRIRLMMSELGDAALATLGREVDADMLTNSLSYLCAVAIAWMEELGLTDD